MTPADAYRILEVEPGAAWLLVRESYLDLVRVWHPDRFEADPRLRAKAEARLAEITAAYRALDRRRNDPSVPPPGVERRRPTPAVQQPERTVARRSPGVFAAAACVLVAIALVLGAWMMARPAARPGAGAAAPVQVIDVPAPAVGSPQTAAPATAAKAGSEPLPARSFIARETDGILATPMAPDQKPAF